MEDFRETKQFLATLIRDRTKVFDFEKVTLFERELFLSLQSLLINSYNYHIDGLTKQHKDNFFFYINKRDIEIEEKLLELILAGFNAYEKLNDRSVSMSYTDSTLEVEEDEIENFIFLIEKYIKLYEEHSINY
ncbi:hypothetical protein [Bacillus sp. Cs-700]|uniref:hypothetical protein n=1 Tax=Bacillus sp. Cs-700 TaxID=2589818 RepID=UPI00140AAB49|nr:hypothetical protein [Bacillus sp. Cs-700]